MAYAKGTGATNAEYAKGGAALGRTRNFMKEPDEFRNDAEQPDAEDQNYGKSGPAAGKGCYPPPPARTSKVIK
jgi:hypothetical protein